MRFHRLQIPAFGPFTNLDLAFPPQEHDLHVFYGKNEAGKSSLLRAIRDLLYGIHGQSPDNFLHEYKNLRLAGEITNRAGARLSFQRRKGNKNTLLGESGNPLADSALLPFLGNVEQGFFSTMFGLGGSELRDGARQILGGDGDIGKALFSASLGGTPVQRVLDALEAESEQFFKGRATSNVSIRPAAKRYLDLLKQSREAVVAAEVWDELNRNLETSNSRKVELEEEIAVCEIAISWMTRCEDALPSVSRFNEEQRLLRELPALPNVASDFMERAKTARDDASEASRKVAELSAQITRDEMRLDKCATSPAVLAKEDELDGLHQDLGAYRSRKESLSNLQSKLAGIEPALHSGMQSLEIHGDFEVLQGLRLGSAARLGLESAAQALIDAQNRHAASVRKAEELTSAIERHESELQSLPESDLEPLRAALSLAAEATESHKTLEATRNSVESLTRKVQEEHAVVHGAPQDLEASSRLQVPAKASLRKFRDRFDELDRDLKAAAKIIRDENAKITKLKEDLTRLERRGELPTEDSLRKARDHRDHGWNLVLQDWKGGGAEEQLDPERPLVEAFPLSIQAADFITDQLRLDADAVAQAEEKRMQIQASQNLIIETQAGANLLHSAKAECLVSWEDEWSPAAIQPRLPDEMEEWRENWIQFRDTLGKLRDAEVAMLSKSDQIQKAVDALKAALGTSEAKTYSVLHAATKTSLQQSEEAIGRRKLIAEQMEDLRDELKGLSKKKSEIFLEIETSKADWQSRSQSAGLAADTPPDTGLVLLQERAQLIAKFDQWKECSGEANKISERIVDYEKKVSERSTTLGVEAATTEAREAVLWKMLSVARTAQTEHDQIASQIADAKSDLAQAEQEESKASEILHGLMTLAKLSAVEELEPLLAALERKTAIQERLDNIRDTLGGLARGQSVEEFVRLIQAENADDLSQRKERMASSLSGKKSDLQGVQAELNDFNRQRDEMAKAGDAAADLRQQAESELATLRRDAAQFMRLRLAAHFLRSQIEKFREQNQAPLLEKSGQVFRQITGGAFEGLSAEFNDQDIPVLVGSKANGVNVPIEGMSDGTRDQLYLALRLAALERHLDEHEPMPLILDDLLITFDNDRTRAILPQLSELSKRTQVFLFTHHEHLVDLCRETLGAEAFQLHHLTGKI
ncbi:MAG: AAA family ATPase [Akkermansiaceae bacterium]